MGETAPDGPHCGILYAAVAGDVLWSVEPLSY